MEPSQEEHDVKPCQYCRKPLDGDHLCGCEQSYEAAWRAEVQSHSLAWAVGRLIGKSTSSLDDEDIDVTLTIIDDLCKPECVCERDKAIERDKQWLIELLSVIKAPLP